MLPRRPSFLLCIAFMGGVEAPFCKRTSSDQNGVSFLLEEEGTALGAPRGVSLCRFDYFELEN